jgi:hypothetical protein
MREELLKGGNNTSASMDYSVEQLQASFFNVFFKCGFILV